MGTLIHRIPDEAVSLIATTNAELIEHLRNEADAQEVATAGVEVQRHAFTAAFRVPADLVHILMRTRRAAPDA